MKIVRIKNTETDKTVGVTGSKYSELYRYPASFLIPEDDPQFSKEGNTALGQYGYMLNSRTWVYDIGLALIVFTISGDYDMAEEMLQRLGLDQNDDGSWNFSYDTYIGKLFHDYIRTGSLGWLGWGMCYYMLKTGKREWVDLAEKGAEYVLGRQIDDPEDLRHGLLTGGFGSYSMPNYEYSEEEIEWCSTEHNSSALQYLWGIYWVTGKDKYRKSASMVEEALVRTLWDEENGRFYQGVGKDGVDKGWALDCTTWAGMASMSFGGSSKAEKCLNTAETVFKTSDSIVKSDANENYNMSYEYTGIIEGHKPYSDKTDDYEGAPDLVWSEGTLGTIALLQKLGRTAEANHYLGEMFKMLVASDGGGVLYTTKTLASAPWEFHVWESVVSSAWLYILLKDPNALWTFHTSRTLPTRGSKDGRIRKVMIGKKMN